MQATEHSTDACAQASSSPNGRRAQSLFGADREGPSTMSVDPSLPPGVSTVPPCCTCIHHMQIQQQHMYRVIRNEMMQQVLNCQYIEIANFEWRHGEDPMEIVRYCALLLGIQLGKRDIMYAMRLPPNNFDVSMWPPILVRMKQFARHMFFRAAHSRRAKGYGTPTFFINDALTPANRRLFCCARRAALVAGWKFVWINRGAVFARYEDGTAAYRIRDIPDIQCLFGVWFSGTYN